MLAKHRVPVAGREVLDAGCGSGFFVDHYLEKGAHVTGVDLTDVAVERLPDPLPLGPLRGRRPLDVAPGPAYDLVSCFDVLFHIVDDAAWDAALTNLTDAVKPGGWFVFTEHFFKHAPAADAAHNKSRGRGVYETALIARGLAIHDERPTHHLMNRELGAFKFLNRVPELIYRVDLGLLMTGLLEERRRQPPHARAPADRRGAAARLGLASEARGASERAPAAAAPRACARHPLRARRSAASHANRRSDFSSRPSSA